MHPAIEAAIAAAATIPDMATDVARFLDGTTVTRHVINYPAAPGIDPDTHEPITLQPYTQTIFEIRDPQGRPTDYTSRITVAAEDR